MNARIAVVGAGVTGLSTCYHLEKLGFREISLFDPSHRVGGKLRTDQVGEFLVETGPDSIFVRRQEIWDFFDELGLCNEVIEPKARGFSIYLDGALRQIPPGVSRVGGIDPNALAAFDYLSEEGKRDALAERFVPPNLDSDESVAAFFRRRFGMEYATKIAEPLYAGTHGGVAQSLSMQALYPDFRSMERQFGSLTAAEKAANLSRFVSFKGGTEALAAKIDSKLNYTSKKQFRVSDLLVKGVQISIGSESFDAIVLTLPSHLAAGVVLNSEPAAAKLLDAISASSSVIISFGYDVSDQTLELGGTGFLVPEGMGKVLRGATWSSSKWSNRAPESKALLRAFLTWQDSDDSVLVTLARSELKAIAGIDEAPTFHHVMRWERGLPQYRLGHLELVLKIEATLRTLGRLFVAGQSYRGAGIPDCIRQGRDVADAVRNSF